MQYAETLPLQDHEVVLTFDDGPLPRYSNQVLDILASQCVKATFFIIGSMAQAYPEGVRKVHAAGHSIGTHTQNHPAAMKRMPIERAKQEIDDGVASVKTAVGDGTALALFFRIPGLSRAEDVEDYVASQGIQTWSADFPADDWRHISSSRVYDLAMKRIEEKGRGILLLHDIQPRTVAALPRILHELKVRGYRIVHVVPATAEQPATPTEPQQWQLHPPSETVAISHWPKVPNFVFSGADALPAPSRSDFESEPSERGIWPAHGAPLAPGSAWYRPSLLASGSATGLPVPARSVFEIPEGSYAAIAPASQHAKHTVLADGTTEALARLNSAHAGHSHAIAAKRSGQVRKPGAAHVSGHGTRLSVHSGRHPMRHPVQIKKEARGVSIRNDL